jgi:serine protease
MFRYFRPSTYSVFVTPFEGQSHYSLALGNIAGAEFGIPAGQSWFNPTHPHGTHVAGTIVAQGGNDEGIVGVIPSNKGMCLLISRVFSDAGGGQATSEINKGVEWCAANGARVITMSLTTTSASIAQQELIQNLVLNNNILVVAAAGNLGNTSYSYPASYSEVISVGAVDLARNPAPFSQFNHQVGLAAPGVGVLSTMPGNSYGILSGTSMATPHVAGVIAKIWAARPQCTNQQVREAVEKTALDSVYNGTDDRTGHGIVQVKDAYQVREMNS